MNFKDISSILKQKGFYGFTVKRGNHKLIYTFRSISHFCVMIVVEVRSISHFCVMIVVEVIRVNPETFGCKTMVGRITINGQEIEDLRELKNALKNDVYSLHKREFVKTFKKV